MTALLTLIAALFQSAAEPAPAQPVDAQPPLASNALVVVELFTSQGCPMCPDANRLLAELGEREDVLALGWGVSYWDLYGWEDRFAHPDFVARQQAYVDAGDARRVYTPHFVVNGDPQKLRFRPERIRAAVDGAQTIPVLAGVERTADGVQVTLSGDARARPAQVWAAHYYPGVESQSIDEGPNAGRDMTHFNMVRQLVPLGEWSGGDAVFAAPAAQEDGLACAILVQDGPGGVVLAAARLDPA